LQISINFLSRTLVTQQNLSTNSKEKGIEMRRRISKSIQRVEGQDYKSASTHFTKEKREI